IKTSGARSRSELEEACRISLRSLLGDAAVPDQIAVLMPIGLDRWPRGEAARCYHWRNRIGSGVPVGADRDPAYRQKKRSF
ncbi:hypothetical protein MKK88_20500, partial [Methylobacterium sp. E-005]|nr:hypothetical protein [Methylobacterium sp. E-005]